MHSPRSPIYGETLAHYTRAVYPCRWPRRDQCFMGECPGRRRNPSRTYIGTYDIMVKINYYMDPRCNKYAEKIRECAQIKVLPWASRKSTWQRSSMPCAPVESRRQSVARMQILSNLFAVRQHTAVCTKRVLCRVFNPEHTAKYPPNIYMMHFALAYCHTLGLNFNLTSRSHEMTPREGFTFFDFF
jgi:hypothetical protein